MQQKNHWVLFRIAAYLRGKGIMWGCGDDLYHRPATSKDSYCVYVNNVPKPWVDIMGEPTHLSKGVWDFVVVGEEITPSQAEEAKRFVRPGGYFITWGSTPGVMDSKKWSNRIDYSQDGIRVGVWKKQVSESRKKDTRKRVCVVRYGALGDYIIMTPVLEALHKDGYHVTLNTSTYPASLAKTCPWVDNIIIQERDIIPNQLLGPYWDTWSKEYDRYINLSESLEGSLLKVEGRREFFTPQAWRIQEGNKNYYDYTLMKAGYPDIKGQNGTMHLTPEEDRWGKKFVQDLNSSFVVAWSLRGSSHHKVYPVGELVAGQFLQDYPDAKIITLGDTSAKEMSFEGERVVDMIGKLTPRESAAIIKHSQCVISPESFAANVAGCFDVPKVIMMSHSSPEALSKYWKNCINLLPSATTAPCYPCFQLHYTKPSCPLGEFVDESDGKVLAHLPVCTMSISPSRVYDALVACYNYSVLGQTRAIIDYRDTSVGCPSQNAPPQLISLPSVGENSSTLTPDGGVMMSYYPTPMNGVIPFKQNVNSDGEQLPLQEPPEPGPCPPLPAISLDPNMYSGIITD